MSDVTQDKWKLSLCVEPQADVCKGQAVYILETPSKKLGDTACHCVWKRKGLYDVRALLCCDAPRFTFSRLLKQVIKTVILSIRKSDNTAKGRTHRSLLSIRRTASSRMRRYLVTVALFAV
jgi:hypothetical protein